MMKQKIVLVLLLLVFFTKEGKTQRPDDFAVIAYYTGDAHTIDRFELEKLTHIIFSFCHLKDGRLYVDDARDTVTIRHLVDLKRWHPRLKVMLSLGGWGGCEPCSDAFSTPAGRTLFAESVKAVNDFFGTDGIDLDWEYPAIEGYPGHSFKPEDRENFTALVAELRKVLGERHELSFAAGGFQKYLDQAIEWDEVMPLVDRVNIMSYDLVNGYSTVTGHHTPLYSVHADEESTNRAVEYLLGIGIPPNKLVIGAAFYTRVWKNVAATDNGRYQTGEHTQGYHFKRYEDEFVPEKGWTYFYDEQAEAPYWYNASSKQYATGDDLRSVKAKTRYALEKKLGGIMFWELTLDKEREGMVYAIDSVVRSY